MSGLIRVAIENAKPGPDYRLFAKHQEWFVQLGCGVVFGPFANQLRADVEGGFIAQQVRTAGVPLSLSAAQALAADAGTNCHFPPPRTGTA